MLEIVRSVNMNSRDLPKIVVRLPRDIKDWLVEQAADNAGSQTSEIVRAVRERMARCQSDSAVAAEKPAKSHD
jgi:Arc-like DNA binding domain